MLVAFGFAGLSLRNDGLAIDPHPPAAWRSLSLTVRWRRRQIRITIDHQQIEATLQTGEPMTLFVRGESHDLLPGHKPLRVVIPGST
jgi:alpha,alpha-trehalose phosphorylase